MKLLYITDKFDYSPHNFIDIVFNKYLKDYMHVDIVYFTKNNYFNYKNNKFLVPYKNKISDYINIEKYDFIIVRNFFWVLNMLFKEKIKAKIGFQLSFPHSYRRLHEAILEQKSIFRKTIEYNFKRYYEKNLIQKCDFFLPISSHMIKEFYADIKIPYFILPLGVDPELIIKKSYKEHSILKMIYIGTIDKLRQFNVFMEVLESFENDNWILDIYSNTSIKIPANLKNKISYKGFVDRDILLTTISKYDLGIFILPENKLYNVASPIKVMEYYQSGICSFMSNIPECKELFYPNGGFFTNFNHEEIKINFHNILKIPNQAIYEKSKLGQNILLKKRNYKTISNQLNIFLRRLY